MGYFISIPSICKYLFIIAVIYFGERLFVRKSSKNGCSDNSRCSSLCHGSDESVGNISGKAGYGDEEVVGSREPCCVFDGLCALQSMRIFKGS